MGLSIGAAIRGAITCLVMFRESEIRRQATGIALEGLFSGSLVTFSAVGVRLRNERRRCWNEALTVRPGGGLETRPQVKNLPHKGRSGGITEREGR